MLAVENRRWGFFRHPETCESFILCHMGRNWLTRKLIYRSNVVECGEGEHYDAAISQYRCIERELTKDQEKDCRHAINTYCEMSAFDGGKHPSLTNCAAYWQCHKGKGHLKCCGDDQYYDPILATCADDKDDNHCQDLCVGSGEKSGSKEKSASKEKKSGSGEKKASKEKKVSKEKKD
jgi:hypothetical protein